MRRFDPDRKGPPLVYFTSTWSPFAISRESSFQNEVRAQYTTETALRDRDFQKVLERLPIPLIGVPWYQADYLPGTLVIAHEAGHVVESDFELTGDLDRAISAAGLDYSDSWIGWASEVFADCYACLCMGPSYVSAAIDILSTSVDAVQGEERYGGLYPTRALRVEVLLEALCQAGHPDESRRLRATWEATYGAMQTMRELAPDVPKVVAAIYAGEYRGFALTALTSFPAGKREKLERIADAAAGGLEAELKDSWSDVRELFAAAQVLHEMPRSSEQLARAHKLLLGEIVGKGAGQYRMRGEPVEGKAALDARLRIDEDADRARGRELAVELRSTGYRVPDSI